LKIALKISQPKNRQNLKGTQLGMSFNRFEERDLCKIRN